MGEEILINDWDLFGEYISGTLFVRCKLERDQENKKYLTVCENHNFVYDYIIDHTYYVCWILCQKVYLVD